MSGFGLVLVSVLLGDFRDWQKAQLLTSLATLGIVLLFGLVSYALP